MRENERSKAEDIWDNKYKPYGFYYGIEEGDTRETFIAKREKFITFAVVKNGEWFGLGEVY
jgi:hypothetical protein